MNEDFELGFWTWYATDEYKPLFDACRGMVALDFLQSPASVQRTSLRCCPECDIDDLMSEVEDFLRCSSSVFPTLERQLTEVLTQCSRLPASAFSWAEAEMFTAPDWEPVRAAASTALQTAGWSNLRSHVEEFLREGLR